jgi:hypothetical protein
MQVMCKKCSKDVTMEVDFQEFAPYKIINNHKCDVKAKEMRDRIARELKLVHALEAGFIL